MNEELAPRNMEDAAKYIKSQEPLHNVYESSDFVQGMARGRLTERQRILNMLEEDLESCQLRGNESYPGEHNLCVFCTFRELYITKIKENG